MPVASFESAPTFAQPWVSRIRSTDLRRETYEHVDFAITEFRKMKIGPSLERALRHKGLLKA